MECDIFLSVLWHCWLGDRKGIRPVKKLDVGLLVVIIRLELCMTYSSSSPVVTTTSIILCFNKHWLTHVTWKKAVKTERERERDSNWMLEWDVCPVSSVTCLICMTSVSSLETKNVIFDFCAHDDNYIFSALTLLIG